MRLTLAALCLCAASQANAQCPERIVENIKVSDGQRLVMHPQLLVVRGSYAYSLAFSATRDGLRAELTSRGGEKPNKDDELLIITKTGEKRAYKFVSKLKTVETNYVPTYSNHLKLDLANVEWMASNEIEVVTLIDNIQNQGRRFTLPPSRQAELAQLIKCFLAEVDASAIPNIAAVVNAIPSVARKPTVTDDTGTSLSAKPGRQTLSERDVAEQATAEAEVTDLRAQLAAVKQQLMEEIALEKAKAERAKATLRDDLQASREAAALQQQAIAAEQEQPGKGLGIEAWVDLAVGGAAPAQLDARLEQDVPPGVERAPDAGRHDDVPDLAALALEHHGPGEAPPDPLRQA